MDCASKQEACVPLLALLGVRSLLSAAETRLARLVCKEWAIELAGSVDSIQLPPHLWQTASYQQAHHLKRLSKTYWSSNHAKLLSDSSQDVCAESLQLAVQTLGGITALCSVTVNQLGSNTNSHSRNSSWATMLQGLAGLPGRISSLDFEHARLPGPEGLSQLSGLQNITRMAIHTSSSSSKLQQEHIVAIAGMQQLTSLQLSFRTVSGCLAQPLTLDCLGQLSGLRHLEIAYTGMLELASGVCFAGDDLLPGCTCLSSLALKRIPTPSLRGLFRQQQLRHLTLVQLSPLVESQARSLGLCTQLESLILDITPLELVPRLASLTSLTSLQLAVWDPPANGGADLPGGLNILSLTSMKTLTSLSLSGPVLLCHEDILTLAAAWQSLVSLSLAVTLVEGSQGFAGFSSLEVLRLRPWQGCVNRTVGDAGLGGEEDGPLLSGARHIFMSKEDLPASLIKLEGQQLVFMPVAVTHAATLGDHIQGVQGALGPASNLSGHRQGRSSARVLKRLKLHFSPDGVLGGAPPQLPTRQLLQGLTDLELQHPFLTCQQLTAAVASCGNSLTSLTINTADVLSQFRNPVAAEPYSAAAAVSAVAAAAAGHVRHNYSQSTSRRASNSGGKLTHSSGFGCYSQRASHSASNSSNTRISFSMMSGAAAAAAVAAATGPVAAAAGVPQLGNVAIATAAATAGIATAQVAAGALSRNNSMSMWSVGSASLTTLLTDALSGLSGMGSNSATGFSNMGHQLSQGSGLAVLAQCTALEELSLVVGDRVLGTRTWEALASLPKLRRLTLAVASDTPAAVARDIAVSIAGMKGLTRVGIGLEGPGSGDVANSLVGKVAGALPACQVYVVRGAPV